MEPVELRIHGVSGTPPESMLGLAPVGVPGPVGGRDGLGPDRVDLYEGPPPSGARAYSWGGLTSGRWTSAIWLLLLPHVLVNVAGWAMLPAPASGNGPLNRTRVAVIRVVGLLSTLLGVLLAAIVVVDVVAWQAVVQGQLAGVPQWLTAPRAALLIGLAVLYGIVALVWWQTRVRPAGRAPWDLGQEVEVAAAPDSVVRHRDPTLRARLDDDESGPGRQAFWTSGGLIERLRALHIAAALTVIAVHVGAFTYGWGHIFTIVTAVVVVVAAALVAARSLAGVDEPGWFGPATGATLGAGIVAMVAAFVTVAASPPSVTSGAAVQQLSNLRWEATGLAAVVAGLTFVLLGLEFVARLSRGDEGLPRRASTAPTVFALLGLAVAGAAGAGAELLVARFIGGAQCAGEQGCPMEVGPGAHLLAVTFAAGIAVLVPIALTWFAVNRLRLRGEQTPPAGDTSNVNMRALRRMLTQPTTWTTWLLGLAVAGLLGALALLLVNDSIVTDLPRGEPSLLLGGIVVAVLAGVVLAPLALRVGWPVRLAAVIVACVLWFVVDLTDWQFNVIGFPLPPQTPLETVLLLGLLGPVVAVGLKAWGGLRSREDRRKIGVLWDLGMFWPRWYHPLTPPTYSDQAAVWFRSLIRAHLAADDRVLVSAHSQGSVVAVGALIGMSEAELRHVALLTYGSPVGRLYGELLRAQIDEPLLSALREGLTSGDVVRWRNLHRVTDPIGGPIVHASQGWLGDAETWAAVERTNAGVPLGDVWDPNNNGHSNYIGSREYTLARADLAVALEVDEAGGSSD